MIALLWVTQVAVALFTRAVAAGRSRCRGSEEADMDAEVR